MDPGRMGEWVTIVDRIDHIDPGPIRPGFRMSQTLHLRGVPFKVHWTLEELDAPRYARWEGSRPGAREGRHREPPQRARRAHAFQLPQRVSHAVRAARRRRLAGHRRRHSRKGGKRLAAPAARDSRSAQRVEERATYRATRPLYGLGSVTVIVTMPERGNVHGRLPGREAKRDRRAAEGTQAARRRVPAPRSRGRGARRRPGERAAPRAAATAARRAPRTRAVRAQARQEQRQRHRPPRPARRARGTRGAEALALVRSKPGITIPEIAEQMGIKQNYLYRVLPGLAEDGLVKKDGRGWHPEGGRVA